MKNWRVGIIDDEQLAIDNLTYVLKQFSQIEIAFQQTSAISALQMIREGCKPDLVFMDISMREMNGLEAANELLAIDPKVRVVFLTAYDQYAIDSFQANTLDYIIKPVTAKRLERMLQKLTLLRDQDEKETENENNAKNETEKVIGFKNNSFFLIEPENIVYITMAGNTVVCCTKDESFVIKHSISYWEKVLDERMFVRCHRGYIVNIKHIKAFSPMYNSTITIHLDGRSETLTVTRSYISKFKQIFHE